MPPTPRCRDRGRCRNAYEIGGDLTRDIAVAADAEFELRLLLRDFRETADAEIGAQHVIEMVSGMAREREAADRQILALVGADPLHRLRRADRERDGNVRLALGDTADRVDPDRAMARDAYIEPGLAECVRGPVERQPPIAAAFDARSLSI